MKPFEDVVFSQELIKGSISAFSSRSDDLKNHVLTDLRNRFPECHVFEARDSEISLLEFAEAEQATASIIDKIPHLGGFSYNARLKTLERVWRFVAYRYQWQGTTYLLFSCKWKIKHQLPERVHYILSTDEAANTALFETCGAWSSARRGEVYVFHGLWERSGKLGAAIKSYAWDKVVLDPQIKEELYNQVSSFFQRENQYRSCNVPWKRGIILHGPPGNGKTSVIKAIMNTLSDTLDNTLGATVRPLYVQTLSAGPAETKDTMIRRVFGFARQEAPCVLVFEDIDSQITEECRTCFLNEVDGIENNDGIFLIATANDVTKLDPAIGSRPSRFDRNYFLGVPNRNLREMYYKAKWDGISTEMRDQMPEDMIETLVAQTDGLSFAHLQELWLAVWQLQIWQERPLTTADIKAEAVRLKQQQTGEKRAEESK